MKTKKEVPQMELRPFEEGEGNLELRKLYINGKTDKVFYFENHLGKPNRKVWRCMDEYHNERILANALDVSCKNIPQNIYSNFETSFWFRWGGINIITLEREDDRLIISLQFQFHINRLLINPYLLHAALEKHLYTDTYGDEEIEFIYINLDYPLSGTIRDKLSHALNRVEKVLEKTEKQIMQRIIKSQR